MPKLFGTDSRGRPLADPSKVRTYTKHDTDYWKQPSLADKITEAVHGGLYSYDELREWAESEGYAPRSFYQTISNLQTEGLIESRCGGLFPIEEDTGDGLPDTSWNSWD